MVYIPTICIPMVCLPMGMYMDVPRSENLGRRGGGQPLRVEPKIALRAGHHPFGTWDSFFMNLRKDNLTSTLCVQDSSADLGVIFRSLQERPSCLSQLMPLLHRKQ